MKRKSILSIRFAVGACVIFAVAFATLVMWRSLNSPVHLWLR